MSLELPKDELNEQEAVAEESAAAPAADAAAQTEEASEPADPFSAFANPEVRTKENLEGDKRKKKRILLFSLIGVFALLAALIVLLIFVFPKEEDPNDTTETVDTSVVLFDKTTSDADTAITSAVFKNENGTVEIVNKDGVLYAKGYEGLPVHATNMGDLETLLTKMTAVDDIGEIDAPAEFGLDTPQTVATITYHDGSKKILEIGDMSPDQAGCYMREQGSNHVYILGIDDVAILLQSSLDYVSTAVFTEPTVESSDEGETDVVLREMTLGGSVRKDNGFTFRLVTSDDSDAYIYYTYIITEPFLKGSNSAYDTELGAFTSLSAEAVAAVHPSAEDLKTYGLDDPYSTLTFTLAKRTTISSETEDGNTVSATTHEDIKQHTLRLSKADSDYYYAMIDDVPIIYLVSADSIAFAAMQYDDFADTLLFLEDITQISTFKVTLPEKETVFQLTHNPSISDTEKNMTVTANGNTYDTMDFRYLVNDFMDIKRYSSLTQDVEGLPLKMEIAITRLEETEPVLTVKFYEVSSNLYAAVLSHGERYQVKASDVNFVIEQYENYLKGETVLR